MGENVIGRDGTKFNICSFWLFIVHYLIEIEGEIFANLKIRIKTLTRMLQCHNKVIFFDQKNKINDENDLKI